MDLDNLPIVDILDGTELIPVQQGGVWKLAQLARVLAATPDPFTPPVTGFTATDIDYQQIDLAWTGSGDFVLQRSLDENSWETIYEGSTASHSDVGLYEENQYFYRVSAQDTGELVSTWEYADATTPAAP